MKFSKWILGTAFLLSAQIASVQGASSCDPCDPCYQSNPCDICDMDLCDVEYDFYVDALYWEFCKSDLQYDDDDDTRYLNPDWQWGWRIGGVASWKCWDLGFRYTSFCFDHSTKHHKDKIKFEFDFDVLDLELGYACCLPCGMSFRPFVGAKLAWIDDEFKDENQNHRDFEKSKIEHDGYGLYIGASSRWELCSYCACDRDIPIALVTRASTGLLHGDFELKNEGSNDRKERCIFVPVHELYVGLDMSFCDLCGCGDAFFQIGYEAQYWGWLEYGERDDTAHLGLGGLVLRFGVGF